VPSPGVDIFLGSPRYLKVCECDVCSECAKIVQLEYRQNEIMTMNDAEMICFASF